MPCRVTPPLGALGLCLVVVFQGRYGMGEVVLLFILESKVGVGPD